MKVVRLGRVSFQEAFRRQEEAVLAIAQGSGPETLYLLEHPHLFTIGRGGNERNLLSEQDWNGAPIELLRINRGGDVTYHGPGQLVGYIHLNLKRRRLDVHAFLRSLEESLIRTARRLGLEAFRREGMTGVWTQGGKLASIGIGIRRWVTMHGFALNVNPDLHYFKLINPCGITACEITSISRQLGQVVELSSVEPLVVEELEAVFAEEEGGVQG